MMETKLCGSVWVIFLPAFSPGIICSGLLPGCGQLLAVLCDIVSNKQVPNWLLYNSF